jgi:hypothetical protein
MKGVYSFLVFFLALSEKTKGTEKKRFLEMKMNNGRATLPKKRREGQKKRLEEKKEEER